MLRLTAHLNKHKIDEVLNMLNLSVQPLGLYSEGRYRIEFYGSEDELGVLVQGLEIGYVTKIEVEYMRG